MMITGRIFKTGKWWAAHAPIAGVATQGRSRADAKVMLADALEALVDRPGFKVTVSELDASGAVLIEANPSAALAARVLHYQRGMHGLTLAAVADALGASSRNAYARYEQGRAAPTLDKLCELLRAVAPELTIAVLPRAEVPARSRTAAPKRTRRRAAAG
jgi:DNA-binding XRE family transcriptional regulator